MTLCMTFCFLTIIFSTEMKTKTITLTVNIPDNGKPYNITTVIADATPPSLNDHDRIREIRREVWLVDAVGSEARTLG